MENEDICSRCEGEGILVLDGAIHECYVCSGMGVFDDEEDEYYETEPSSDE